MIQQLTHARRSSIKLNLRITEDYLLKISNIPEPCNSLIGYQL